MKWAKSEDSPGFEIHEPIWLLLGNRLKSMQQAFHFGHRLSQRLRRSWRNRRWGREHVVRDLFCRLRGPAQLRDPEKSAPVFHRAHHSGQLREPLSLGRRVADSGRVDVNVRETSQTVRHKFSENLIQVGAFSGKGS